MSVDTISDFLTIIRNAVRVSKAGVVTSHSMIRQRIAEILKEEGFIRDFMVEDQDNFKVLKIFLKYVDGFSVIHEINRMSKPGRRMYRGYRKFEPVIGGLGIAILTTSKGIMTDKRARLENLGGEVVCTVW